jgi:hypothetical protein
MQCNPHFLAIYNRLINEENIVKKISEGGNSIGLQNNGGGKFNWPHKQKNKRGGKFNWPPK